MKQSFLEDFFNFIREKGIVGLAVGFILGSEISKFVTSLVTDIINPVVGLGLGTIGDLKNLVIKIWHVKILIGDFISNTIDFFIIIVVVYFGMKIFRLDTFYKKK